MPLSERDYMRDPERTRREQTRHVQRSFGDRWFNVRPESPTPPTPQGNGERDRGGARRRQQKWGGILRFALVVVGFGVGGGVVASIILTSVS